MIISRGSGNVKSIERKFLLLVCIHLQLAFTCSKSTMKTWKQCVTYLKTLMLFCLYCRLWTDIICCSDIFIADFEQVNAGWLKDFLQPCQKFVSFIKNKHLISTVSLYSFQALQNAEKLLEKWQWVMNIKFDKEENIYKVIKLISNGTVKR